MLTDRYEGLRDELHRVADERLELMKEHEGAEKLLERKPTGQSAPLRMSARMSTSGESMNGNGGRRGEEMLMRLSDQVGEWMRAEEGRREQAASHHTAALNRLEAQIAALAGGSPRTFDDRRPSGAFDGGGARAARSRAASRELNSKASFTEGGGKSFVRRVAGLVRNSSLQMSAGAAAAYRASHGEGERPVGSPSPGRTRSLASMGRSKSHLADAPRRQGARRIELLRLHAGHALANGDGSDDDHGPSGGGKSAPPRRRSDPQNDVLE